MKKFRCTVCGYVHEGDAAPEKCPLCKAPASKFVEVVEVEGGALSFADEHVIGVAKGCDEEMIKDLNIHPFGQGNQRFSAFGLCGQRCHAPRCRHHAAPFLRAALAARDQSRRARSA